MEGEWLFRTELDGEEGWGYVTSVLVLNLVRKNNILFHLSLKVQSTLVKTKLLTCQTTFFNRNVVIRVQPNKVTQSRNEILDFRMYS